MRFQVKEALDKVSELVSCNPNEINIERVEPNYIQLSYVNENNAQVGFVYTDGEILPLLDEASDAATNK
ncbi:hypothetical protein [Vibrio sp. 99-8-1]|uniref:hypothetical protein n=1 Tax=Vibrio sp. 99-8-1 TaxID=2607602 RepID=UPI001493ABB2|nr:hypothetical protein [Vibrio sp. 99-8-1]NOI67322.1 hypothetical protein [Vibrio sp. 99-8-1]